MQWLFSATLKILQAGSWGYKQVEDQHEDPSRILEPSWDLEVVMVCLEEKLPCKSTLCEAKPAIPTKGNKNYSLIHQLWHQWLAVCPAPVSGTTAQPIMCGLVCARNTQKALLDVDNIYLNGKTWASQGLVKMHVSGCSSETISEWV